MHRYEEEAGKREAGWIEVTGTQESEGSWSPSFNSLLVVELLHCSRKALAACISGFYLLLKCRLDIETCYAKTG